MGGTFLSDENDALALIDVVYYNCLAKHTPTGMIENHHKMVIGCQTSRNNGLARLSTY